MKKEKFPKKLDKKQSDYFFIAINLSNEDKINCFDFESVRKLMGYSSHDKTEIENTDTLKELLDIEYYLLKNNFFFEEKNIRGKYKISSKGKEYIKWQKKIRKVRDFFENNILKNKIIYEIVSAIIFSIFFVILDKFAYHFYTEKNINKILESLEPHKQSISKSVIDIVFITISILLILIYRKRKWKILDTVAILIYIYFRFNFSQWTFWSLFSSKKNSGFLYIDVILLYYPVFITNSYLYKYIISIRNHVIRKSDDNSEETYLTLDLPLKELSENLEKTIDETDNLGRGKFANQIADEIKIMRPFHAFAIGINGPWGSGKTSLIDLILFKIKNDNYRQDILIIEFFPWLSKDTESLISEFFFLLEKIFCENKKLVSSLKAYSKAISVLEKKIFEVEFSSLFSESTSNIRIRYNDIVDEIKNEKKLLIIKIDDLDRLTKDEIIDSLRLIRVIANFPNTVYIVGYDKSYITSAIKNRLTEHNPEKYLDKVFNVEFKIPEMSISIINERLKKHILQLTELLTKNNKISPSQKDKIYSFFERNSYHRINHFIENERDILRFSNNLFMKFLSIKGDVDFSDFFYLELINYKYPEIYTDIYKNKELLTN